MFNLEGVLCAHTHLGPAQPDGTLETALNRSIALAQAFARVSSNIPGEHLLVSLVKLHEMPGRVRPFQKLFPERHVRILAFDRLGAGSELPFRGTHGTLDHMSQLHVGCQIGRFLEVVVGSQALSLGAIRILA